jgi:hypothetical protein
LDGESKKEISTAEESISISSDLKIMLIKALQDLKVNITC